MQKTKILKMLQKNQTVFTSKEFMLFSGETNNNLLLRKISYYIKKNEILPLRRGIYAKDKNYNRLELANRIFTPSYISFETVLSNAGIIFQYYDTIFVASYLSRTISCNEQSFSFHKIKNNILTDRSGIENHDTYFIATKERAFLDLIYLNDRYHFDNLSPLDWQKIFTLLPIYNNKRMLKSVKHYYDIYMQNNQ